MTQRATHTEMGNLMPPPTHSLACGHYLPLCSLVI